MTPVTRDQPEPEANQPIAAGPASATHFPREDALPENSAAEDEEVDVWWGAYSGRSLLPRFLLTGLLSLAIALAAWFLWDPDFAHPQVMGHATVVLMIAVWITPLCRWCYLSAALTYRLTTRRLLCDRGFYHMTSRELELSRIQEVLVERSGWERRLGIGRLRVVDQDHGKPFILEGVLQPERIAAEIRRRASQARERTTAGSRKCPPHGTAS